MYENLCDIKKIEYHYHKVRLNTKHRDKIYNFETYYMTNIMQIYYVLKNKTYVHSPYNVFLIKEPKYRIIMSEIISDKIINRILSEEILLPIIEPRLIEMNVATRKDKGLKKGLFYVKKYINNLKMNHDNFYILKCDITKYFYSIDHDILITKLSKIIKDKDVINLIKNIITATNNEKNNIKIRKMIKNGKNRLKKLNIHDLDAKFEQLDNIPLCEKGKGIPIGNMSSQIFAVFYLNDLDHFIKEKLKIKHYIRYMDDFILMHPDKEYLKYCLAEINKKVEELKLKLNKKTQIISIKQGLPFIGYRFVLKNKRLIILLNSQTKRRIKKKLKYLKNSKNVDPLHKKQVIASYKGYLKNADSGSFIYQNLKEFE